MSSIASCFFMMFCLIVGAESVGSFATAFTTAPWLASKRHPQRISNVCRRPSLLGLRAISSESHESERHPGDDPGGFLEPLHGSLLPVEKVKELFERGYVIIDDVFSAQEQEMFAKCISLLAGSSDGLAQTPEASVGVRDDYVRFVEENSTMIPIRLVIKRLKGFAEYLQVDPSSLNLQH